MLKQRLKKNLFIKFIAHIAVRAIIIFLVSDGLFLVNKSYGELKNAGKKILDAGINAYEKGNYEKAIDKLGIAVTQLHENDKDNLWDAHFYLGLSYHITGDDKKAREKFKNAQKISDRVPDKNIYSSKIVGLFKEAAYIGSPQSQINPVVLIETSKGNIKIELFEKESPLSVKNFLSYLSKGFYNNLIFHRVIENFMIQGGGFDSGMNKKKTKSPIKNEAANRLSNKRGTISMARTSVIDSATSQFFINLADNSFLDHKDDSLEGFGYAVFGKVVEGMDIVDKISKVKTGTVSEYKDVPIEPIIINRMKILREKEEDNMDIELMGPILPPIKKAEKIDPEYKYYNIRNVKDNDRLNIRSLPHYKSKKIGSIPSTGKCIKFLDDSRKVENFDWYFIKYGNIGGWVNSHFLEGTYGCIK